MKTVMLPAVAIDKPNTRTSELPEGVKHTWEWQLNVAASEVALGPVSVLIDTTGIEDFKPIKLMRESDYGA